MSSECREFIAGLRKKRAYMIPLSEFLAKLKAAWTGGKEVPADRAPALDKEIPAIIINSLEDWRNFRLRLGDVEGMRKAARGHEEEEKFGRIFTELNNRANSLPEPDAIDENASGEAVSKAIKITRKIFLIMEYLAEHQGGGGNKMLDEAVKTYLANIGARRLEFNENDPVDAWIDLNMKTELVVEAVADSSKWKKIARIYVQPHAIRFRNSQGEEEEHYFGGKCAVYGQK